MNSKIFTLSMMFLLCIGYTNAQGFNPASTNENAIDVVIVVDNNSRAIGTKKGFRLHASPDQIINQFSDFKLRINLEYLSSLFRDSYFRLAYNIGITANGIVGTPSHGTTAPVIIPPVKKKILSFEQGIVAGYPYLIPSTFPLTGAEYKVYITLIQYETEQDQQNDTGIKTLGPEIEFTFKTSDYTSSPIDSTTGSGTVNLLTYPNPSTDYITIELANITTNPISTQQQPIQLAIFNKNGGKVSSHTITRSGIKNKNALYTIATTNLPKDIYFFEITHGKSKTVKTIIKK
ncbi:T9SS type A sorting domain-containing protein [uncultured Kordia sp.]|uniref:T9SS type A sorting domain-containing protein n=1 Tax=uncultured Kordia sp. TaxID=507699 RepID=UPI002634DC84|nr:T9SS type A sorting domain-containing protein [uncultured Kordia sp.]